MKPKSYPQVIKVKKPLKSKSDIHCLPRGDIIDHKESLDCICGPIWDEINKKEFESGIAGARVIIHKRIIGSLN